MLEKRLLMGNPFNSVSLNGGVFGINKHVYAYYRFANDLVAEDELSIIIDIFSGYILTREETQLLINQYLENSNDNQLYIFYISGYNNNSPSLNSIFQCCVDIPALYNGNLEVGFIMKNYEQGKVGTIRIIEQSDVPDSSKINYKNGYSQDTFIGGIRAVFD